MADRYENLAPGLDSPYVGGFAITPNDNADLLRVTRAIWVGGTGAIAMKLATDQTVILAAVPVGLLRVRAKLVMSTGTTATNLVGLD